MNEEQAKFQKDMYFIRIDVTPPPGTVLDGKAVEPICGACTAHGDLAEARRQAEFQVLQKLRAIFRYLEPDNVEYRQQQEQLAKETTLMAEETDERKAVQALGSR